MSRTTVHLAPEDFQRHPRLLLEHAPFSATAFRYETGVAALQLENDRGAIVVLPYQGQQVWSARFDERELTMVSLFDQPRPTRNYLETYGGFLVHCGATAMGVPGSGDTHPLHGELPNAPYASAYLEVGEDELGHYLSVGGRYRHTVAFATDYVAEPALRLRPASALIELTFRLQNLKRTPMELMYLAHVNFRPVDGALLAYTAPATPDRVRVRRSIPAHLTPAEGYPELLERLARRPEEHHLMEPGQAYDPEVVFEIDYDADPEGWAHSLQLLPDGSADYVAHRPEQLGVGLRWICRTPDQDALGLVLPATAGPEGYHVEKRKGRVRTLEGGETFACQMWIGTLSPPEAESRRRRVEETTPKL